MVMNGLYAKSGYKLVLEIKKMWLWLIICTYYSEMNKTSNYKQIVFSSTDKIHIMLYFQIIIFAAYENNTQTKSSRI